MILWEIKRERKRCDETESKEPKLRYNIREIMVINLFIKQV